MCIPSESDHLEEAVRFYHFEPSPLERSGLEYATPPPMPVDKWKNDPQREGEFDQGPALFLVRWRPESDSGDPLLISFGYDPECQGCMASVRKENR